MTTQKKSQRRSHIGHLFNRLTSPLWFIPLCLLIACDSGTKELLDIAIDEPERKEIDVTRMGVNSFFVNPGFGSIQQQYSDIHENMGLNYVRVLFAWTNGSQPTPNSEVNYGLFDNILSAIPAGTDVLVVVAHTPDWMSNPANWTGGNPRATWVEKWLSPVVNRYKNTPGIVGWEIWNEPDNTVVASDAALGLEDPANYFELLSLGSNLVRRINPGRLVVPAATTAINQNYPENLNYNKRLVEFGALDLVDVWNVHYYGKQFENVVRNDGVEDFLEPLPRPIWITESGARGVNNQLAYCEQVWPFLREEIPNVDRIYYYEYSSSEASDVTYGLRNLDPAFPVSDLYISLKNR